MRLEQTVAMMNSADYKERFRAEYFQVKIRINGLSEMLDKYRERTLEFTPTCSYEMLENQLRAMEYYRNCLTQRAEIENINLSSEGI